MILDAESLALAPEVEVLIGESEKLELPGRLKTELFASVVELNTDICDSVGGAHEALSELRRAAARIAEENRLRIAAAILILVILAFMGARLLPVYLENMRLQSYVEGIAQDAENRTRPDDVLRVAVLEKAAFLGLPVKAENVSP